LNLQSSDFICFATAFGVGFLCGLFVRRYFKYIVFLGVSLIILLAVLQSFAMITINVAKIQQITGLQDVTNMNNILLIVTQEIKKHALKLSCSGVGFILGLKIG